LTAEVDQAIKKLDLSLKAAAKKQILAAVSWKDKTAVPVRKINQGHFVIDNVSWTITKADRSTIYSRDTEQVTIKDGAIISPPSASLPPYELSLVNSQLYEPDSDLRDTENVPLTEDIPAYFEREVLPHVPDAWIDPAKTTVGYEISFTRYFYKYEPLRSLEEITADLLAVEQASEGLLLEIIRWE
jgi:type I restriction enzyme M protein